MNNQKNSTFNLTLLATKVLILSFMLLTKAQAELTCVLSETKPEMVCTDNKGNRQTLKVEFVTLGDKIGYAKDEAVANLREGWMELKDLSFKGYVEMKTFLGYENNAFYSTALTAGTATALTGAASIGTTGVLGFFGVVTAPAWAPVAIAGGVIVASGAGVMMAVENYDYSWKQFEKDIGVK